VTFHQDRVTGFIKYRAVLAGDWTDQSLQVGVRVAF